jgi:hypothetical protein
MLTKRHIPLLPKKIIKSCTKLTIYEILKNATMSSVRRIGHWTMLIFLKCDFCLFSCVNLQLFLAIGRYVTVSGMSSCTFGLIFISIFFSGNTKNQGSDNDGDIVMINNDDDDD